MLETEPEMNEATRTNPQCDRVVRNFIEFLSCSYAPRVIASRWGNSKKVPISEFEFVVDWAQANWELLVEQMICSPGQYIRCYGQGSDGYDERDNNQGRVFFVGEKPTHEVLRAGMR